jgi:hypothetical protein
MNRVLVAGVVSVAGLGDALQCYVGALLVKRVMPYSEVIIHVSGPKSELLPRDTWINYSASLVEQSSISYILKRRLQSEANQSSTSHFSHASSAGAISRLLPCMMQRYYMSKTVNLYARPALCKLLNMESYDCGLVGGHTIEISAFFEEVLTYRCARVVTRGPLISFPLSISALGLSARRKHLDLLKRSLNVFDAIFVRGSFSRNIITKFMDEDRVFIGLDAGFGVRLLNPKPWRTSRERLVMGIIPRRDYFYFYQREGMYAEYLKALKKLIEYATANNLEVLLIPHSLRSNTTSIELSDENAIEDLLGIIGEEHRRKIKVAVPKDLLEDIRLLSSLDVLVTSRMHAGILALAYDIPSIFFQPKDDVKVLDLLSMLGFKPDKYLVDCFNPKCYDRLYVSLKQIIGELSRESKIIKDAVDRSIETLELPVRLAAKLLR